MPEIRTPVRTYRLPNMTELADALGSTPQELLAQPTHILFDLANMLAHQNGEADATKLRRARHAAHIARFVPPNPV